VVDFHGLMGKIDQSNRRSGVARNHGWQRRVAFAHDHGSAGARGYLRRLSMLFRLLGI